MDPFSELIVDLYGTDEGSHAPYRHRDRHRSPQPAWLEQGRDVRTTVHVIDALARAFRLEREAHRHLRYLAGLSLPEPDQMPEGATPDLDRLLGLLSPAPACVFGPSFYFLAWNDTFATIWDPPALPADRCNLMWLAFADAAHRRTWVDWDARSRMLLGEFRAAYGQHSGEARFTELVEALSTVSTEFRTWWTRYDVRESFTGPLVIRQPGVGTIHLDVTELRVGAYPSLTLAVHVPVRPSDRRKLAQL
ncbi:MAG: helix-turn-helix transcriptional regulator [Acidimicrobiales bacterium]